MSPLTSLHLMDVKASIAFIILSTASSESLLVAFFSRSIQERRAETEKRKTEQHRDVEQFTHINTSLDC